MKSKILIITGSNGYILRDFNFDKYSSEYHIYYLHKKNHKKEKNHFQYDEVSKLKKNIKNKSIKSIIFISFGSHLGGHDPKLYFDSILNLEKILKLIDNSGKECSIYHASSFSTFNPILNSSIFPLSLGFLPDHRGPYSFSKSKQDNLIKKYSFLNKKVKSKIIYLGHVHSFDNDLLSRFKPRSFSLGNIVISFIYSPFKLINPISKKNIHYHLKTFLELKQYLNDNIEYEFLTDSDSPKSLFRIFLENKKLFISPIAPIICTFIGLIFCFTKENSNLRFYCAKFLQINNSIKI